MVATSQSQKRLDAAVDPTKCRVRFLSSDSSKLKIVLDQIRENNQLSGMACSVVMQGSAVATACSGYRTLKSSVPVTINDKFHIGSCTKAMTATLVAMLIEETSLDWQTKVSEVFPELIINPGFQDVTIEMLMAHKGGMPNRSHPLGKSLFDMHQFSGSTKSQRYKFIKLILSESPETTPGTNYVYSNTGYAMLGAISERVTNTAWEKLITQRLFSPLRMTTAGFGAMGTPGLLDQPLQHFFEKNKYVVVHPGPMSDNPVSIAPGGGVHCSIGDWTKFAIMHLEKGEKPNSLLKPETFARLHTDPFGGTYMGGWVLKECDWADGPVLSHNGSNTMNFAHVRIAPSEHFAVLVATNHGGDAAQSACDELISYAIERFENGDSFGRELNEFDV